MVSRRVERERSAHADLTNLEPEQRNRQQGTAMPLKPCLTCGRLSQNTRCPTHTRTAEADRTRRKRLERPYTYAEQQRRAATVKEWVLTHGWWCPGWRREAHASTDLTADHITAVAAGGREDGPLAVLCRSCNSAKRDHT